MAKQKEEKLLSWRLQAHDVYKSFFVANYFSSWMIYIRV